MKISEENWKRVVGGLAAWHGVSPAEWLLEAWQEPLRLSTLVAQLELWDLGSRIQNVELDRLKKIDAPVIGFLEEENEMVLILPPKKGSKPWATISSSGKEASWSSLRDLRKSFGSRKWTGQSITVEPLATAATDNLADLSGDWFWTAIWKYRKDFLPILPASILINLFALAMPLFIMNVYDRVVPNEALSTLWVLTSGVCVVFVFEFLLRIMRGSFVDAAGKGADRILSGRVFRQLVQLELSSRPPSAGNLAGKAVGYETVREFLSSITLIGLIDFPFALFMFIIVFMVGGLIGWIPVVATFLILGLLILFQPSSPNTPASPTGTASIVRRSFPKRPTAWKVSKP
ncbi:MAG: hypothetical protein P1V20_15490 [Verrucomicrobiales bacterium]|nr:hypothetical protein [Verrucomicrobiales bacterium]